MRLCAAQADWLDDLKGDNEFRARSAVRISEGIPDDAAFARQIVRKLERYRDGGGEQQQQQQQQHDRKHGGAREGPMLAPAQATPVAVSSSDGFCPDAAMHVAPAFGLPTTPATPHTGLRHAPHTSHTAPPTPFTPHTPQDAPGTRGTVDTPQSIAASLQRSLKLIHGLKAAQLTE